METPCRALLAIPALAILALAIPALAIPALAIPALAILALAILALGNADPGNLSAAAQPGGGPDLPAQPVLTENRGGAPALQDIPGGRVRFMIDGIDPTKAQVDAGRARGWQDTVAHAGMPGPT